MFYEWESFNIFSCDEVRVISSRDDNRPFFFWQDLSNRALQRPKKHCNIGYWGPWIQIWGQKWTRLTSEVIGGCLEARCFKHFDTMEVELIKGPWENNTYCRSSIGPLPFYWCIGSPPPSSLPSKALCLLCLLFPRVYCQSPITFPITLSLFPSPRFLMFPPSCQS